MIQNVSNAINKSVFRTKNVTAILGIPYHNIQNDTVSYKHKAILPIT